MEAVYFSLPFQKLGTYEGLGLASEVAQREVKALVIMVTKSDDPNVCIWHAQDWERFRYSDYLLHKRVFSVFWE